MCRALMHITKHSLTVVKFFKIITTERLLLINNKQMYQDLCDKQGDAQIRFSIVK